MDIGGAWIAAGIILYFIYSKQHGEKYSPFILLDEHKAKGKYKNQIMLPVQHGHISQTLAVYTSRIAHQMKAELLLAAILSLPHYAPQEEALKGLEDVRPFVKSAKKSVNKDVPVHTVIGRSETAARGIVSLCKERKTNMLVLGWKGYTETKGYNMERRLIGLLSMRLVISLWLNRVKPDCIQGNP